MFFVIGFSFCFVLPCFAMGCHAFGLKIATAALRPRNDTKIGMVLFGKQTFFVLCGRFLRGVVSHRFSNVSVRKLLWFTAKPIRFVIARRAPAPDAAIFDDAICHPETNYSEGVRLIT